MLFFTLGIPWRTARGDDAKQAPSSDVVVTGTRTPERSQRSTVKTDVVTREESERRGAGNVAEALATQPGVQVNPGAYGYLGNVGAIQIQGFDLRRVLVLEDGEPVLGDVGGAVDLSGIPTSDIERIEIVTGPTSALYGSSALGGVVNIITGPPSRAGGSGRARVERRSRDGLLAAGGMSYRWRTAWIGAESSVRREDGVARLPDRPDTQVPDRESHMLGIRGGASIADSLDVRFRARWLHDSQDGLSSRMAPGLGRYLLDEGARTDRFTIHLVQSFQAAEGSTIRATLGRQWAANETSTFQRGSVVGDRHLRRHEMHSAEVVSATADGPRTWVFGGRGEAERFDQRLVRSESLSGGVLTRETSEVAPRALAKIAAYGQLQWKLGSLTLLPGARLEAHSQYGEDMAPRFAAAWRPVDELTLRASVGRGFRSPTAKELGFAFDHAVYGYRVIGNPDLRPEASWGTNADATVRLDARQVVRAGVFANWVTDLIDLDLAHGTPNGAVVDYRYANIGRARTAGGQIALVSQLPRGFRTEVAYDYLYTRDDVNARPLGGRPPHTVTAALRAPLADVCALDVRLRAVTGAFVDPSTRSPGYATLDIRVSRAIYGTAVAYLGALNATDTHQDPLRSGDLRPPVGRTLYAGIKADFPLQDDEP